MSDYAQTIALPAHKLGDRWPAAANGDAVVRFGPVTFVLEEGEAAVAPANALERVVFTFRYLTHVFIIDSDPGADGLVTLVDVDTWIFEIPTLQTFLPVGGKWEWDCALYDAGNEGPLTLYKGTLTPFAQV